VPVSDAKSELSVNHRFNRWKC